MSSVTIGSDIIRRRRPGPFKRSRTGCATCKRRGKKCDEKWSDQGYCQRCLLGQWECAGKTPSTERHGRAKSQSTTRTNGSPEIDLPVAPGSSTSAVPIHTAYAPTTVDANAASGMTFNGFPSQPLYNWPTAAGGTVAPAAFLTTCNVGSLAIDTQAATPWSDMTIDTQFSGDFWNEMNSLFTPTLNSQPQASTFNSGSRVLFLSGEKPMRQGVSLAEIYARVVESWLVGIPSTTRDYARARILALNDRNSVMRAVRYAVASAYIFLFASDPSGANDPSPKLVELAYRGAGIVKSSDPTNATTTQVPSPSETSDVTSSSTNTAIRKIRLYVDHVSTPFAADLESTKWTEDAIQELRQVIVKDESELSDLLWGVIDLQLVEFIRGGAAPSYNMLSLGDRLVRSAMGEDHPPLTLARLRSSETFSLRLYALSDISRCIVQRGRRTIFNFWTDHKNSDAYTTDSGPSTDEEPWATYLGLPDSIVILLAEVVNLCADLSTSSSVSIKAQAEELETALRARPSTPFSTNSLVDSTALISRTIAGELWRLAALILLYQSVHKVGSLHPVLRKAQVEMLSLLDSIVQLPNGDLWGFIALPAFLAACLSITESDRQRAKRHMARPGPERVWLDNIALVERLWDECDETGRLADWHDKMTREGLSVAFF